MFKSGMEGGSYIYQSLYDMKFQQAQQNLTIHPTNTKLGFRFALEPYFAVLIYRLSVVLVGWYKSFLQPSRQSQGMKLGV